MSIGLKTAIFSAASGTVREQQTWVYRDGFDVLYKATTHQIQTTPTSAHPYIRLSVGWIFALRTKEMCEFSWLDFDFQQSGTTMLIVQGKNHKKPLLLNCPPDATGEIAALYIASSTWLQPVSQSTLRTIAKRVWGQYYTPYSCRRGRATHLYRENILDMAKIAVLLRDNPSTVSKHYIQRTEEGRWGTQRNSKCAGNKRK